MAIGAGYRRSAGPPKAGGSADGVDADFEGEGVAGAAGAAGGEAALLGGAFAVDAAEGVPGARLQGELGVDGVAVHGAACEGAFVEVGDGRVNAAGLLKPKVAPTRMANVR